MKLYETSLQISAVRSNTSLFESIRLDVCASLPKDTEPVRFVVTESTSHTCTAEIGVCARDTDDPPFESIFRFAKRRFENTRDFNAVLLVPTGIGATIGGHAGDAAPVSQLMASVCDHLVTHPNVVNASDLNEMTENTLYVEGSVICRLLMGTVGLQKVRSNRVLTVIEKHPTDPLFLHGAINAVNAARAAGGLNAPQILILDPAMKLIAEYSSSGRAVGRVECLAELCKELHARRPDYDSVAISSIIRIPSRKLHKQYFESNGAMINPWGGVEAIFTHTISSMFNVQSAHSPMMEDQLVSNMDVGIVDARQAAEAVSFTYMQCILKGLQRAPRIVTDADAFHYPGVISASDISCLVIPDGCIGLPTLAALEQGIPVIAVKENSNLMRNDLTMLPWARGQLHIVENYLEALGVMAALKAGVPVAAVRRPLANAELIGASLKPMAGSHRDPSQPAVSTGTVHQVSG